MIKFIWVIFYVCVAFSTFSNKIDQNDKKKYLKIELEHVIFIV